MALTVIWTYFSPAIPQTLGQLLPRGLGVSGPWESYYLHHERGLGTVGYNHAHVAAMVLLQGALLMMLRPAKANTWVLLGIVVACFLSGARAGLVGALLFMLLESLRMPLRSTLLILLAGVAGLLAAPYLQDQLDSLVARQATILQAGNTENLAGRGEIWQTYLRNLMADPVRLLLGSGLGSGIANNGSNAHMMVLQVLYETGLAGLTVMVMLFWKLMTRLYALRSRRAGIGLNVLIGLWATTFATETLYPNSAFGSFLPLLALAMVVALTPEAPASGFSASRFQPPIVERRK
ncbi:O-antigen ligase family protein [Deinococcus sp. Marseille-Q6407]|uniref:O-antigen ligase family protein n=1 Tax=Deinococcus sp. Marseille-Q6407 TaxID=2969223 RepID=UPI0039657BF1